MHPSSITPHAPSTDETSPSSTRRSGHLYPQVATYLASRPGAVLKVGEITRAIGAPSAGAVFEALKRMAAAGYATHHTGPHRFEVTQAGIDAAGTLPPPAPRSPSTRSGTSGAAPGPAIFPP
jgi:nitric oxide reductase NorQ protein